MSPLFPQSHQSQSPMAATQIPIWLPLFRDSFSDLEISKPRFNYRETLEQMENLPELLGGTILDKQMASCCIGAFWLKADFFDEAHRLFQEIHTPTGSLWHGISHRREGDHANASYWFSRCRNHPATKAIRSIETDNTGLNLAGTENANGPWDYDIFNRLVENRIKDGGNLAELRNLEENEWRQTILWTLQKALGKTPMIS